MARINSNKINALTACLVRRLSFVLVLALSTVVSVPVQAKAPKPDGILALILIRDALSVLNHANWTGNYTVLRDYASPNFSRNNDPSQLAAIFQPIRAQKLNLAATLYLAPKITKAELTQNEARLQLTGFFPSKPKQLHFNLTFESVKNRWRIFGIGVKAVEVKAAAKQILKLKIDEGVAEPVLIKPVVSKAPEKPVSTSKPNAAKPVAVLPNVTVPKQKPDE